MSAPYDRQVASNFTFASDSGVPLSQYQSLSSPASAPSNIASASPSPSVSTPPPPAPPYSSSRAANSSSRSSGP